MTAEAGVALASAWKARSPALLGFGGDSLIELLSAGAVFWRFRDEVVDERTEKRTAQIGGILLRRRVATHGCPPAPSFPGNRWSRRPVACNDAPA